MALVTNAEVKGWVGGDGQSAPTGVDETLLTECVLAAGEEIIEETSRVWEKTTIAAEYFSGDRAHGKTGDVILLRRFPLIYAPPTDAITVAENGVSLVVAQGYTTSADVVIENIGLESIVRLIRRNGAWAAGTQNIVVGYKAGFATVPARIKFVAKELAWLYYQEGRKVGLDNVAQLGSSRGLAHKLSWLSKDILAQARRWAA